MNDTSVTLNAPCFNLPDRTGGFQEVWYLKFNHPEATRALWLRFTVLIRNDKSREVAEVWAIFFESNGETPRKVGLKNTFPITSFENVGDAGLRIADSCLLEDRTDGIAQNEEHCLRWSFSFAPVTALRFDFAPSLLTRLKLVKNTAVNVHEHLAFTGWCELDGQRYEWAAAPGMQGHLTGPRNGHSWAWGHCNCFRDTSGAPAPVIWDGLSVRAPLGKCATPPLTSMFFRIGDDIYNVNALRDVLWARSQYDFSSFRFRIRKKGVLFEGEVKARLGDYAGVTYEDTDGSHLYCHNSKISDMTLVVTNPGGKKNVYTADHAAAYEVVARKPHPDIPLLI